MKKKLFAALTALIICLACVPLFAGCSAQAAFTLKEDEEGNKYYSVSCSGYKSSLDGEYVIPETYGEGEDKAPVKEIAQEGFAGANISKVTIPSTVTKIGNAAFAYCNNLKEVAFAENSSLTEISRGCFGYCMFLREIKIPASVKSIGMLAFTDCYRMTEVEFSEGLEKIGLKAFYNCTALTQIVLPDSVTDAEVAAFHGCIGLKLAVVGNGLTEIKSGVFGYCTALEKVYLPATLKKVAGAHYVDGSEEIKYEEGTFYCGHAFHHDEALTDVYYAGTAAEWAALEENIDNKKVNESGSEHDNGALIKATRHYGAVYNG